MDAPKNGLIIDSPHIDNILGGRKTWEMRSVATRNRGTIGLVKKGTGQVWGIATVVNCIGPLSEAEKLANQHRHLVTPERWKLPEVQKYRYAYELTNVRKLSAPVPYQHKSGAVTWVSFDDATARAIMAKAV